MASTYSIKFNCNTRQVSFDLNGFDTVLDALHFIGKFTIDQGLGLPHPLNDLDSTYTYQILDRDRQVILSRTVTTSNVSNDPYS